MLLNSALDVSGTAALMAIVVGSRIFNALRGREGGERDAICPPRFDLRVSHRSPPKHERAHIRLQACRFCLSRFQQTQTTLLLERELRRSVVGFGTLRNWGRWRVLQDRWSCTCRRLRKAQPREKKQRE